MRDTHTKPGTVLRLLQTVGLLTGLLAVLAATAAQPALNGVIELDETVISGNQELPKVLYIVPWQSPDGLPEIELAVEFPDADLFRRLYPPAYRRELAYFGQSNSDAKE